MEELPACHGTKEPSDCGRGQYASTSGQMNLVGLRRERTKNDRGILCVLYLSFLFLSLLLFQSHEKASLSIVCQSFQGSLSNRLGSFKAICTLKSLWTKSLIWQTTFLPIAQPGDVLHKSAPSLSVMSEALIKA